MEKTVLVLPDGREISSGILGQTAIQSCTLTACVNAGTELTPGAVCAEMAELRLLTPTGEVPVAAGDTLLLYRDDGTCRQQLGVYIAEKPERTGAHSLKLTAYDRISLLDRDLTDYLAELTAWPYSLQTLSELVCQACGLTLQPGQLPNGSFPVERFSARQVTGRRLMQWIAQLSGCFCRATAQGLVELTWYTPGGWTLGPAPSQPVSYKNGVLTLNDPAVTADFQKGVLTLNAPHWDFTDGTLELRQGYYLSGALTCADYTVAPVQKVCLSAEEGSVGAIYPDDPQATNTCTLTDNPLLAGAPVQTQEALAQSLYEQLQEVTYTPCRVTLAPGADIRPGQILALTDPAGKAHILWVMSVTRTGRQLTLECTGSPRRDSVSAVNESAYAALSGKVLKLRTDMEGIRAENRAADGRMALLELSVEGLNAQVQKQTGEADALQTELTQLQQTATGLQLTVSTLQEQGVCKVRTQMGYTFDDAGLHIARQDRQMENLLDNTGMYVTRGGQTVLQANNAGVEAADIRVHNYLTVGCSRLERYEGNRTACFYAGT